MDTLSSPIDPVQSADLATGACADKSAYLIVQVESPEHRGRRGPHASTPLQRLRALCSPAAPSTDETLSLTLSDARGHTVLSLPNATPVLGIALVPGTYHLTATRGQTRRGYTVSLPAGARFELQLRFAASEPPKQARHEPDRSASQLDTQWPSPQRFTLLQKANT